MALRFEELIERHHDEIFAYLWRLLAGESSGDRRSDAEDLTQEVYLRAYRGFSRLRLGANHRAWLYKIATNCVYSRLTRRKRQRERLSVIRQWQKDLAANDDGHLHHAVTMRRLRDSVNRLPLKQKACVTLRYLQELDYDEIAQIMSCSQETARANVYQAIRRLRSTWGEKTK